MPLSTFGWECYIYIISASYPLFLFLFDGGFFYAFEVYDILLILLLSREASAAVLGETFLMIVSSSVEVCLLVFKTCTGIIFIFKTKCLHLKYGCIRGTISELTLTELT